MTALWRAYIHTILAHTCTQEKIPQSPERKPISDSTMASADIAGLLAAAEESERALASAKVCPETLVVIISLVFF